MHIISFLTSSFAFRAQLTLFQALTTQLQKRQRCLPSNSSPLTSHFRAGLVFKRVHLLEICMKGVYWKVGIEQECKLQKNRQHIHISTQRKKKASVPVLFYASPTFSLSILIMSFLRRPAFDREPHPLSSCQRKLSISVSLPRFARGSGSLILLSGVIYECCMPTAPAGAGESEPRQLLERNERQKRKEYIEEDAGSYRKFVDV